MSELFGQAEPSKTLPVRARTYISSGQNERRAFGHVDVSGVEIGQHPSLDIRRIQMIDAQPRPYGLVGEQTPGERGAC